MLQASKCCPVLALALLQVLQNSGGLLFILELKFG